MSKQRLTNPVPANSLTASFLRYAYGVKKESFRRWMGQGAKFPERVPVNKGKNIIDDIVMARQYFTPKRLFMQHEMEHFTASKEGQRAMPEEKKAQSFLETTF
jgi:hypothetical protein